MLYSISRNWCCLGSDGTLDNTSILSMADAAEATQALSYLNGTDDGDVVKVSITGNTTSSNSESDSSSGGYNSTVAMSIIYSITGLISLLFSWLLS